MGRSFHAVDLVDVTYICHEGKKGMHWGQRFYQEPGTNHWTELGKLRYGGGYNNSLYEAAKTMTDEELKAAVNRKKVQDEFINAYKVESKTMKKLSGFAEKIIDKTLETAGNAIGQRLGNSINAIAGNTFLNDVEARIKRTSKKVDERIKADNAKAEKKEAEKKEKAEKKEQEKEAQKKAKEESNARAKERKAESKEARKAAKELDKAAREFKKASEKFDKAKTDREERERKSAEAAKKAMEKDMSRFEKYGDTFSSFMRNLYDGKNSSFDSGTIDSAFERALRGKL